MKVLGLDPSLTSFGWCYVDTSKEGKDRLIEKGVFKTTTKQVFVDRYVFLRTELSKLIKRLNPDKIGQESSVFNATQSEAMYAVFINTCEAVRECSKDLVLLTPSQVKGHARLVLERPKGWKMEKADMVEAARQETGGKGRWKHDEADAYWIATIAGRFWKYQAGQLPDIDLTDVERHQFARQHTFTRGKKAGQTERTGLIFRGGDRFFQWSKEGKSS